MNKQIIMLVIAMLIGFCAKPLLEYINTFENYSSSIFTIILCTVLSIGALVGNLYSDKRG